ncbi:MAG TPA: IPT/TIG domain-containing protein [Kofleriaceae bacterium]|nr:IPT/TIG domain-containing protein [Kofleriaceae bacterium]
MRWAPLLVLVVACGDNAVAPPDAARTITLHSVAPARGGLPGGTTIVLDTDGLDPTRPVTVVLGRARATQVGMIDDHTITATTPPGFADGPVDIVVAQDGAHARLDLAFTYNPLPRVITIDPDRGPAAGGTPVTITGSGFTALGAGAATVRFGDLIATDVHVASDTMLTATTPPGPPFAAVGVTVENANGEAQPISAYRFVARGLVIGSNRYGPPTGLFYVDPATGLTTRIMPIDSDPLVSYGVHALATDTDGRLWATTHYFAGPPLLFAVDLWSLQTYVVGNLTDPNGGGAGVPSAVDCKDLEMIQGVLTCVQFGTIYTVDVSSAMLTRRGTASAYRMSLAAIGDQVYAVTGPCCSQATFQTVDLDTGAFGPPTTITQDGKPLTIGAGKATGFDGALYVIGSAWYGPEGGDVPGLGYGRAIYRVDVATGNATFIGRVPFQTTSLTAVDL